MPLFSKDLCLNYRPAKKWVSKGLAKIGAKQFTLFGPTQKLLLFLRILADVPARGITLYIWGHSDGDVVSATQTMMLIFFPL